MAKEAYLYDKLDDQVVNCKLCSHRCTIKPGKRGICFVRENRDGTLYTLVYDKVISAAVDPIEKKPFFHILPGTLSFSIATVGCNFRCLNCQNYSISQMPKDHGGKIEGRPVTPETIVKLAIESDCRSIAYTYTEPTIFFELAYDTAVIAHEHGIKNLFVTNGYFTEEALSMIRPYLDGANVDLKGFDEKKYQKVCGANLQPVLDTIKRLKAQGIWVEVTTLLIPGHNDADDEIRAIANFIAEAGKDIPWHLSAFYPTYRMLDADYTSPALIHRAIEIGQEEGLEYLYSGNLPGDRYESTLCHSCGQVLIGRSRYIIQSSKISMGCCNNCGVKIPGIWT
jgi:pyruvate formate lyase activating enzyme